MNHTTALLLGGLLAASTPAASGFLITSSGHIELGGTTIGQLFVENNNGDIAEGIPSQPGNFYEGREEFIAALGLGANPATIDFESLTSGSTPSSVSGGPITITPGADDSFEVFTGSSGTVSGSGDPERQATVDSNLVAGGNHDPQGKALDVIGSNNTEAVFSFNPEVFAFGFDLTDALEIGNDDVKSVSFRVTDVSGTGFNDITEIILAGDNSLDVLPDDVFADGSNIFLGIILESGFSISGATVGVINDNDNDTFGIDNVMVQAIPEPGTIIGIISVGLVGLLLWRRIGSTKR